MFRVIAYVFPSVMEPYSWKWLNICLLMGSNESHPFFALLMCIDFSLTIKLTLSQPTIFLTSALLIFSFTMLAGNVQAAVWC